MSAHALGRILITGSIAGFMPGSFQAVYNGTKAFIDSFSFALREELRGPLVAGAEDAGRAIERALSRAITTGKLGFEDLKRLALSVVKILGQYGM